MVADHLVNIVQSDLSELRQRSVMETTTRLRLENELSDTKVCLGAQPVFLNVPQYHICCAGVLL